MYISSDAHGHGCQDAPPLPTQSSSSSNITNKASKREAPDDEQVSFMHLTHSFFIVWISSIFI